MADPKKDNPVAEPTEAYGAMATKWELITALNGGTQAMRAESTKYLPQETKESNNAYAVRLGRSFLFNAYRDAVESIVAKPFSKPVVLKGEDKLPEQLQGISGDTDRAGTSLTQFARELLTIGIDTGLMHVWVDYPKTGAAEGEAPRLDEQREQSIRPLLIPVSPISVIGWRSKKIEATGAQELTQLRKKEIAQEDEGAYGVGEVKRVRVLNRDGWELWRFDEDTSKYALDGEGTWVGFKGVPMVTGYLLRVGFMTAVPTLEDLAWLNVAHWQSASDQRNILRFARTGLWFFSGISKEEAEAQGSTLGPNGSLFASNPQAKGQVVEHSGAAIDAGRQDLQDLQQQMQILGLQPFFRLTGGATATEKIIDENRSETDVQAWIRVVEDVIYNAYKMAAKWIGVNELPPEFSVNVYSDFVLDTLAARDLEMLLKMRMSGDLDQQTLIDEVKRRNIFGEDVTTDEILERIGIEGPSLGILGASGDADDDDEGE